MTQSEVPENNTYYNRLFTGTIRGGNMKLQSKFQIGDEVILELPTEVTGYIYAVSFSASQVSYTVAIPTAHENVYELLPDIRGGMRHAGFPPVAKLVDVDALKAFLNAHQTRLQVVEGDREETVGRKATPALSLVQPKKD